MAVEFSDAASDCRAEMSKSHLSSSSFSTGFCRLLTQNWGTGRKTPPVHSLRLLGSTAPSNLGYCVALDRGNGWNMLIFFAPRTRILGHDGVSTWQRGDLLGTHSKTTRVFRKPRFCNRYALSLDSHMIRLRCESQVD